MTNVKPIASLLLAVALLFGTLAPPSPAFGASEEDIRRAKVFQIYLKSQAAVIELLNAEVAYAEARAKGDEYAMATEAAIMARTSLTATYWAGVLDGRVQAEGKKARAKELSAEYHALNVEIYNNLSQVVADHDLNALSKRLDDSAETMNRLSVVVRGIYTFIQEQW